MPKLPRQKLTWTSHQERWKNCTLCPLHERRRKIVLLKGSIPADILFIGEAPSASENAIGVPFTGPAGHLLDHIVKSTLDKCGSEVDTGGCDPSGRWVSVWQPLDVRIAYTNLIACIPKDETGNKVGEPTKECIHACSPRLEEVFKLCRPALCVCVGQFAEKWVGTLFGFSDATDFTHITHPAAILRADVSQQQLFIQRAIITLSDAVQDAFGED